ncbi:hypothetical protein GGX14DRAFT_620330 [Mycena pura]|uniref:Protein kinase domain-containing protein n=1 Tax=Mycena pura TaxID=153505 RepID=A0AAD6YC99_9AGAR|nr:hypothetical protein GGX14DRAFT_620330 [Mycena pura]
MEAAIGTSQSDCGGARLRSGTAAVDGGSCGSLIDRRHSIFNDDITFLTKKEGIGSPDKEKKNFGLNPEPELQVQFSSVQVRTERLNQTFPPASPIPGNHLCSFIRSSIVKLSSFKFGASYLILTCFPSLGRTIWKVPKVSYVLCLLRWNMEILPVTSFKGNPNKLSLVLDVALGLEHIHGLKLVHGDLKEINDLVARSGGAVLANFGLSSVAVCGGFENPVSDVNVHRQKRRHTPELFAGNPNSFASDRRRKCPGLVLKLLQILTGTLPLAFKELIKDVAVMFQVMHGTATTRSARQVL